MSFSIAGINNECEIADNVVITGWIKGSSNRIIIENPTHECNIDIKVSGDNNVVIIITTNTITSCLVFCTYSMVFSDRMVYRVP